MTTLHLICGMAGAGKTTLARKLETEQEAFRFSPDDWIHCILADVHDKSENERLRDIVEAIQWETAQRMLSAGVSVILENGFWGRSERESIRDRARSIGVRVELHFLDPSVDELLARIAERNVNLPVGSFPVTPHELTEWMTWFQKPDAEEMQTYDHARRYE